MVLVLIGLILFFTHPADIKHPTCFTTVSECPQKDLYLSPEHPNMFVLELENGVVVNEGGIVTTEGKILKDTQTYRNDQHRLLKPGRDISKENPIFYDGRLAVISSPGSENWYHWLFQVLPRLSILEASKIQYDHIYINNLKFSWQRESLYTVLSKLGIDEKKLYLIDGDTVLQAKTLIVPSIPYIPSVNGARSFPLWLKSFIHDCFLKKSDHPSPERIYISRSKASIRKILNEPALVQLLEQYHFQTVYLEELPIPEQAHLFHHATIIAGPHGSGFTNLIFCKPGTTVIEIDHALAEEDQRSFYKAFAQHFECPYHPFYTDTVSESELENDLEINLSTFEAFLIGALENGNVLEDN